MGGKLAANVAVHEGPTTTWYRPGESPSAAHARLITNPKAWEGGKPPKAGSAKDPGEGGSAADLEKLTVAELTDLATAQDPPVDLAGAKNKGEIVAALKAAGVEAPSDDTSGSSE